MYMGSNGCGWAWIGALGLRVHGQSKIKARQGINGASGQYLGAMAGEFSPDMMLLRFTQEWSRMGDCR